jgi:propanol-preferring alcohol dehydrogenase
MMAAGEVHIQATAVGTRDDLREVLALAASGKVRCRVTSRPLAQANEVLEDLRHGRIAGRVVLTPH